MTHAHLAEMLDLDAEVLSGYHDDLFAWAGASVPARPAVVDLGAGSGTGTLELVRRFPGATVTAVDVSPEMLSHLRGRAEAAGVADRVRTVLADLDQAWPDLGPAGLIWASASMHHMADPARALAQAFATLRPGGLLVITELDSFPRFLADSEVEARAHEELDKMRAEHGLHMHEDWTARLTATGFAVEGERRFDISLRPPLPAAAGRYAQVALQRMRHGLEGRVDSSDLAALDDVLSTITTRDDLVVRTVRTAWLARRPAQTS